VSGISTIYNITKLSLLSSEEKISLIGSQEKVIHDLYKEVLLLKRSREELKQMSLFVDEEYITIKGRLIESGVSSEKPLEPNKVKSKKKKKVQLPSERYPEAEVIEQEISLEKAPSCGSCQSSMSFSGMYEVSEYLTVTPAIFKVIRQKREKYRCTSCHGDLKTAPNPPRICPGSSYSDEMILDVSLSKYCDLIPVERYSSIASRNGLIDLPPQSLIQLTHYLADFVSPVYDRIKQEVLLSKVIHADETPHRMLEEGGVTKSGKLKTWYLWGFSDNKSSSYFEIHNTRSGDVASDLLKNSICEYLVSDVYSGYSKSVKQTNKLREAEGKVLIKNIYCNAHAYRKFKELEDHEFLDICDLYRKIYKLERIAQNRPSPERRLKVRSKMKPLFEKIREFSLTRVMGLSSKSAPSKAIKYFLKNYNELIAFTNHSEIPIDNNPQERQMRNPVIGRKIWYGNHSLKGAKTSAILFSLVESCKLAGLNPREYFKNLVQSKHEGQPLKTPKEFLDN